MTSVATMASLHYVGNMSFWGVVFVFAFVYYLVSAFAGLHADVADALSMTFLAEEYLEPGGFENVKVAPPGLSQDVAGVLSNM